MAACTGLPRHSINRLCALHYVQGLLDAAQVPVTDGGLTPEERGRAAIICTRIARTVESAKRLEYGGPPPASPEPRLFNAINRMNGVLLAAFDAEVDARAGVALALARVAEESEGIPRTPALLEKRLEWAALEGLLGEFYEALDPGLEAVEQIEKGAEVGAAMMAP